MSSQFLFMSRGIKILNYSLYYCRTLTRKEEKMKRLSILLLTLLLLVGCNANTNKVFSYSNGIKKDGYYEDISASEYIDGFEYGNLSIPQDAVAVKESDIQTFVESFYQYFPPQTNKISNRAVVDGDTVNIDYVGSVDGVEFAGGSTGGAGTSVTIGVTSYIEGFLEQLVGKNPGTTFNVNVTFPENYHEASLQGKDAVFVTTINHIEEITLDDAYVSENLSSVYGWNTVAEMRAELEVEIRQALIEEYVYNYIRDEVTVDNMPESLVKHQEDAMLEYYKSMAEYYEVTLDEFITTYLGLADVDAVIAAEKEGNVANARVALIAIGVAEKEGLTVTEEEVQEYYTSQMETEDLSELESMYGMPYLKHVLLSEKALSYIVEQATIS